MSLSHDETTCLVLNNWIRTAETTNPNVSFIDISKIIIQYAKKLQIAIIRNATKYFSCTLNPHDPTKPFFTNLRQIDFKLPKKFSLHRIVYQRPNHPNQFTIEIRPKPSGVRQLILYDIETQEILKTWNDRVHRYFLGPDFVISRPRGRGRERKKGFRIENIFEEEMEKWVGAPLKGFGGVISEDTFYCVNEFRRKLSFFWPWDEQKEIEEIDIPDFDLHDIDVEDTLCLGNRIYLILWDYDLYVCAYDLSEKIWLRKTTHSPDGASLFMCDGETMTVNNRSEKYENTTQVCVFNAKDGVEEMKEFPLPAGFEDGVRVLWI